MSAAGPPLTREAIARTEIGRTELSRAMAWTLLVAFVATVAAPPLWQHVADLAAHRAGTRAEAWPQSYDIFRDAMDAARAWPRTEGSSFRRAVALNAALLRSIRTFEDELEESSRLTGALLPPTQYVLTRALGVGNEKAYIGRDGWLFYRPEIDYLSGPGFLKPAQLARRAAAGSEWEAPPHPDPVPAVLQFGAQLAARGIELVVMPVPVKPMIHPERFAPGYADADGPLQNPSYGEFVERVRAGGVHVFDAAALLAQARRVSGAAQYLATDTHWRPEAMEAIAARLAVVVRQAGQLSPAGEATAAGAPARHTVTVTNQGDIAGMLRLPANSRLFPAEPARIQPVLTAAGQPWQADGAAEVLFLGDSFANIYSLESMGWGASAGLVEQLGYHLGCPVDRIVRNDDGAFATRQMLAGELARGRDRLAGKRVVVWEFAARELAVGDWRPVDLALGQQLPPRFVVPAPGDRLRLSGTVAAAGAAPAPGSVPYKDHIVAIHLVDVSTEAGPVPGGQALVYAWSMRNDVWTPAARLRPGQSLTLHVRAWADVAAEYEAFNRAEVDDERLMLEEPCWAEEGQ